MSQVYFVSRPEKGKKKKEKLSFFTKGKYKNKPK